jgi:hypothetical protein
VRGGRESNYDHGRRYLVGGVVDEYDVDRGVDLDDICRSDDYDRSRLGKHPGGLRASLPR